MLSSSLLISFDCISLIATTFKRQRIDNINIDPINSLWSLMKCTDLLSLSPTWLCWCWLCYEAQTSWSQLMVNNRKSGEGDGRVTSHTTHCTAMIYIRYPTFASLTLRLLQSFQSNVNYFTIFIWRFLLWTANDRLSLTIVTSGNDTIRSNYRTDGQDIQHSPGPTTGVPFISVHIWQRKIIIIQEASHQLEGMKTSSFLKILELPSDLCTVIFHLTDKQCGISNEKV